MKNIEKHSKIKMQFNSFMEKEDDPTMVEAMLTVHDFEVSENNQIITKEICEENKNTLIGKRIVCKYIKSEDNDGLDALSDHCEFETIDRNGNATINTDTIAIGYITEAYIGDFTDENGNTKEVLYAKANLWNDEKYKDILGLIREWISRDVKIEMSCEYLYMNYNKKDNIEYIQSPIIYTGHCVLNSEDRNSYDKVQPAYKVASILSLNDIKSWNKAVNKIKSNNKKEENGSMNKNNVMFEMLKSTNAISNGDLIWKLYDALYKVMVAAEYNYMYISNYDIYPTENYFLYDTYIVNENGEAGYKLFKATYSVSENDEVTVDYEGREEMEYKLVSVENLTTSLNSLKEDKEKLEKSLNAKETELKTVKADLENKVNNSNELVISLNSTIENLKEEVETMKPIVVEYKTVEYEKVLNSTIDTYKEKFEKAGASEVFNEDSTQDLIKKSINSVDLKEVPEFKNALNQLIVDNIKLTVGEKEEKEEPIKSINSIVGAKANKDLMKNSTDIYEERSGIEI